MLKVLLDSAEFSAKVLQNFCPYNGILVRLLAKVLITRSNTLIAHVRAQAHLDFFVKTSVEVSIR